MNVTTKLIKIIDCAAIFIQNHIAVKNILYFLRTIGSLKSELVLRFLIKKDTVAAALCSLLYSSFQSTCLLVMTIKKGLVIVASIIVWAANNMSKPHYPLGGAWLHSIQKSDQAYPSQLLPFFHAVECMDEATHQYKPAQSDIYEDCKLGTK